MRRVTGTTTSALARWRSTPIGFAAVGLAAAALGCGPQYITVERGPQAYYQTGYPVHDTSGELESILRSVKRIGVSGDYVTYVFAEDAGVTEADLESPVVYALATDTLHETVSKAGTAVVVFRADDRVTLLTTHHAVYYPARRVDFVDEVARSPGARRVASVSVLIRQTGMLIERPEVHRFDVLARDEGNDLALLGVRLPDPRFAASYPPISAPTGDPRRLSWGSFLYIVGYPRGFRMVGRAIASDPNRDRRGSFLTDGLWNEGVSGGVVVAVRGDTGRLEWVGVARASAADPEVRLQPAAGRGPGSGELRTRYDGPVYIEEFLRIQYGITLSVPMTVVQDFYSRHRVELSRQGYGLPRS